MARFLICTIPIAGHVSPGKAIAHQLVAQGHEVWWHTGELFRELVQSTGAKFIPIRSWMDYSLPDQVPPELSKQREQLQPGPAQLKFDLKNFFIDVGVGQVEDILHILKSFEADVILTDSFFVGGGWVSEKTSIPWAEFGISTLGFSSRDTAPFGLGWQPDRSPLGWLRNGMVNWIFEQFVFRDITNHTNKTRATLGLPPSTKSFFNAISPYLYLTGTVPSFEYPRCDLPAQVHFVGPLLASLYVEFVPPAWWADLETARRVVLVTQGTIATDINDLVLPTLKALADADLLVVATTGGVEPQDLNVPIPANARVEKHIPFADLLPQVDLMISNGGFNGVQMALAQGIPLVVAGTSEDKPEICARVEWSGVGINLKTKSPDVEQIKAAVNRVLTDTSYRAKAQAIALEMEQFNRAQRGVELLEALVRTGQPVLRP